MVVIGNKVEFDRQGGVVLEPEFPGRGSALVGTPAGSGPSETAFFL
jgi:hypothetical protein